MRHKKLIAAVLILVGLCLLVPLLGGALYSWNSAKIERIEKSNEAFRITRTALAIYGPPTRAPEVWSIDCPYHRSHGLWSDKCLTDEFDAELIAELSGGTGVAPAGQGCHRAQWDTGNPDIHPGGPYIYCHVRVLDGPSEGKIGWVKEDFIEK